MDHLQALALPLTVFLAVHTFKRIAVFFAVV